MSSVVTEENPTGSNLVAHAIRELDLIGETSYEEPSMRKAVLDLVRTFAAQGHSGSSAGYALHVTSKLLQFKALTPLTNDPDEWMHVSPEMLGEPGAMWQSKRDPEVFSTDGGKTAYRVGRKDAPWLTEEKH